MCLDVSLFLFGVIALAAAILPYWRNSDSRWPEKNSPGLLNRPKVVWETEAIELGADIDRVQVWDAFSALFLGVYLSEDNLQWLGEIVASSPFSFHELAHILLFEVSPVCFPDLLELFGCEWGAFDQRWLIEECLKQQKKHPVNLNANPNKPAFFIHALSTGPPAEAYFLLYRARGIRSMQTISNT